MTQQVVLTKGSTSVEIHASEVEQSANDILIKIALPISKNRQEAGTAPITRLYDFKRYTISIRVRGMLVSETGSSAFSKKQLLTKLTAPLGIIYTANLITLTDRTETFTGHIERISVTDKAIRQDRADSGEADKYDVEFLFIIGDE